MNSADLTDAILAALGDNDECDLLHKSGIYVHCKIGYGDQSPLTMRLVVPIDTPDPMTLVYDLCYSLIAETGNNDACDLLIRERSAHFNFHPDLATSICDLQHVVYDAVVLDYMS